MQQHEPLQMASLGSMLSLTQSVLGDSKHDKAVETAVAADMIRSFHISSSARP